MAKKRSQTVNRDGRTRRDVYEYIDTLRAQMEDPRTPEGQKQEIGANLEYAYKAGRIPPRGRGMGDNRRTYAQVVYGWRK